MADRVGYLGAVFDAEMGIVAHTSMIERRIAECEDAAWENIKRLAPEPDAGIEDQEMFLLRRRSIIARLELEVFDMRAELILIRRHGLDIVRADRRQNEDTAP